MALKWRDEWEIGNDVVDAQHKELFHIVNDFSNAYYNGKGIDVIENTLNFLLEYTVKHFADEETLQWSSEFPEYEEHKKLHDAFKEKAVEMAEKLKAEGPSRVLIMRIISVVGGWLVNHVAKEDKKIGDYLNEKSRQT